MDNTYSFERREKRSPDGPKPRLPAQSEALSQVFDDYLKRRELNPGLARFNGWYPSNQAGDQAPRVVIPCSSPWGVAYWQARSVDDTEPRYQSPPTSRFDSIVVVWPAENEHTIPGVFIVAEGPFDALAAAGEGAPGVALMGNQPPYKVWDFIRTRFSGQRPVIMPDSDSVGAALSWCLRLQTHGFKPTVHNLYPHKDLASVPKAERGRYVI